MSYVIAVDFDGICVSDAYPNIGEKIGAADVLRKIVESGHKLILLTYRFNTYQRDFSDQPVVKDAYLDEAVRWFDYREIPLYGINSNPDQAKETHPWYKSKKVFANLVIDYYGMGVPLKYDYKISDKPIADWANIEQWLTDLKIIKPSTKD